MGWLFTWKPKGQSVRDFFAQRFSGRYPDGSEYRLLDCAVVNLNEAYLACERVWPDGRREVSAVVCLLDYRHRDGCNFGYKDMGEEMHPFYYNCPERILRLLTPTENKYALEWREECWKRIRERGEGSRLPRLSRGLLIRFEEPILFRGGIREREFRVDDPRRLLFTDREGRVWFKLSRRLLRERPWAVVPEC